MRHAGRVQLAGDAGGHGFLPVAFPEVVLLVRGFKDAVVVVEAGGLVAYDLHHVAARGHGGQIGKTLALALADHHMGVGAGVLHLDLEVRAVSLANPERGVGIADCVAPEGLDLVPQALGNFRG